MGNLSPLMDEERCDVSSSHIYNELSFSYKKGWNLTIYDYIDGPKWNSQIEKYKYWMISLICGI